MTHISCPRRLAWALRLAPLIALAMPAAAGQSGPADDALASLIAAEHSFAADAARLGINPAFRAHAAADSILLRPDPRPALAQLATESDDPGVRLEWQPVVAAVARSNDLGFTTGPYRMSQGEEAHYGRFLTIWLRGDDGKWRWYLDHGVPTPGATQSATPDTEVVRLDTGAAGGRSKTGEAELAAAEEALNAAVARGDWDRLVDALAEQGYLLRPRDGMVARADAARLLAGRPGFAGAERLGTRISAAGDLATSYGRLTRAAGKPGAYYVRIWRREAAGWRLLVDELT